MAAPLGQSGMDFAGKPFDAERPTNKAKEFWSDVTKDSTPQGSVGADGNSQTLAEWHNSTRTDDFQELPQEAPPHDTIIVKDRAYFDGTFMESLPRHRFDAKLKHNLDNWARDQELRRQVLDWQASEAHAVDLLAQKEYSQMRTRDRKVERIHLETCSGAYFVRPSDNQVIESIDASELAMRTNGETANLLKTLAGQVPLDVIRTEKHAVANEAQETMREMALFDARMGNGAEDDSDDD